MPEIGLRSREWCNSALTRRPWQSTSIALHRIHALALAELGTAQLALPHSLIAFTKRETLHECFDRFHFGGLNTPDGDCGPRSIVADADVATLADADGIRFTNDDVLDGAGDGTHADGIDRPRDDRQTWRTE
jgi:hypothetical protein